MTRSLAAFVVVLGISLLPAEASRAKVTFEDLRGDAPPAAPDITTVAVSNTSDGEVTFQVKIANFNALPRPPAAQVHLALGFDLDRDSSTGDVSGEEAAAHFRNIFVNNGAVDFWLRGGDVPETNMSSSLSSEGVLTFTVNRSELLDVKGFVFRVTGLTFVDGGGLVFDLAPNVGRWDYELVFPPPRLSATKPIGTPARPVAGRRFMVRSTVTRSDTGEAVTAGSVRCTVRVGTARLRAEGRFQGGRAQCVVAVPRKAKGKTLRGSMAVRAAGASVTKPYSFRIV